MALYKYLGPYDEVKVSVAGHDMGTVEKDASIAVPDELADLTEWAEENWERADKPKARTVKEAKADLDAVRITDNK